MQNTSLEFTDFGSLTGTEDDSPNSPSEPLPRVEKPRLSLLRGSQPTTSGNRNATEFTLGVRDLQRYAEDWLSEAEYLRQSPATIKGKRETLEKLLWFLLKFQRSECGTRELRHFIAYIGNGHER